jgi:hypothetical protein
MFRHRPPCQLFEVYLRLFCHAPVFLAKIIDALDFDIEALFPAFPITCLLVFSIFQGMQTKQRKRPTQIDDPFAIQTQSDNGGTPGRGKTNEEGTVFIPYEMIAPDMLTRMKQRSGIAGFGVNSGSASMFVIVAALTGESQIVERIRTAATFRNNMLDGERIGRECRLMLAILTASLRAARNGLAHKWCIGSVRHCAGL